MRKYTVFRSVTAAHAAAKSKVNKSGSLLKLAECDARIVQHPGQLEDRAHKACGGAITKAWNKSRVVPLRFKMAMTTIVGIFDNARGLDKAVERLALAGLEDTVYDEAIVEGEAGNGGGPVVFAPGYAPAMVWRSAEPESRPKRGEHGQHTIVEAFKAHLPDCDVSAEVIQAYAVTFYHNGEFILVKTDAERAEQAMEILRGCGATRVNRHD